MQYMVCKLLFTKKNVSAYLLARLLACFSSPSSLLNKYVSLSLLYFFPLWRNPCSLLNTYIFLLCSFHSTLEILYFYLKMSSSLSLSLFLSKLISFDKNSFSLFWVDCTQQWSVVKTYSCLGGIIWEARHQATLSLQTSPFY